MERENVDTLLNTGKKSHFHGAVEGVVTYVISNPWREIVCLNSL